MRDENLRTKKCSTEIGRTKIGPDTDLYCLGLGSYHQRSEVQQFFFSSGFGACCLGTWICVVLVCTHFGTF